MLTVGLPARRWWVVVFVVFLSCGIAAVQVRHLRRASSFGQLKPMLILHARSVRPTRPSYRSGPC